MAAWLDLFPLVAQHCPNAPTPAVEFWLREAAIEFCRRTLCHQVTLADFDSVANTAVYMVNPGTGLAVSKLLAARFNGSRLQPIAPAALDEVEPRTPSFPEAILLSGLNQVTLWPAPATVAPVSVRVALEPTRTAATLDDNLAQEYGAALAAGAARKLAMAPDGRDEAVAMAAAAEFEAWVGRANAAVYFGRSRSGRRSTPQWV